MDLFLTGPAIEEVSARTEEYVREHRFEPVASLSAKAHQAARGTLGKLRQLWAFFAGADTPEDQKVTAQFLRKEMGDLFDKSFAFGKSIPAPDLDRVRNSLIDHLIPADGSLNAGSVDQVMTALSNVARLAPPDRFEKLVALREYGADTSSMEVLKNTQLSNAAEDALNARTRGFHSTQLTGRYLGGAAVDKFYSTELKRGWERAIYPYAMAAWLEGKNSQQDKIAEVLRPFLPATIECAKCVEVRPRPGHIIWSGCYPRGQLPPCD